MSRRTVRDRIWIAALQLRSEVDDPDTEQSGLTARHVLRRVNEEDPAVSMRTVRDTLHTMQEAGFLTEPTGGAGGQRYEFAPEWRGYVKPSTHCMLCQKSFEDHDRYRVREYPANSNELEYLIDICGDCVMTFPRVRDLYDHVVWASY